jgi:hypothetical protein
VKIGDWVRCVAVPDGTSAEAIGWVGIARTAVALPVGEAALEGYDLLLERPDGKFRRLFWPNVTPYTPTNQEVATMMRMQSAQLLARARQFQLDASGLMRQAMLLDIDGHLPHNALWAKEKAHQLWGARAILTTGTLSCSIALKDPDRRVPKLIGAGRSWEEAFADAKKRGHL